MPHVACRAVAESVSSRGPPIKATNLRPQLSAGPKMAWSQPELHLANEHSMPLDLTLTTSQSSSPAAWALCLAGIAFAVPMQ